MTEKIIPKRKKDFIEFHKNSTETDLLKDILYNIEQNSLSQKKIESDIIQIQKNTFNVFVVLLIPIILSALIYTFLFLIA
jgi:predicted XRE-type DNA-binding protein